MNTKSTDALKHEITAATDIEDYLEDNRGSFIQHDPPSLLNSLISQKGIHKADVVRDSLLSRAYVYQIFSGAKTPSRDTLIAIAFGAHLSDEETQMLLRASKSRELYARDQRDAIILFARQRDKSILEANDLLFAHGLKVLGLSEPGV